MTGFLDSMKARHRDFREIERRVERGDIGPEDIVELCDSVPGFKIWWKWRCDKRKRDQRGEFHEWSH